MRLGRATKRSPVGATGDVLAIEVASVISTPAQMADFASEIRRLLDDVVTEYRLIHDLGYRQGARGEAGRATGTGDPTGEIATARERERYRKASARADELMADAVGNLRAMRLAMERPLRDRQTWTSMKDDTRYPPPMGKPEHLALVEKADQRKARGEE